MPKNNSLTPVVLPMPIRFNEKPDFEFKNDLENINVTLVDHTPFENVFNYLPGYVNATWADKPQVEFSVAQRVDDIEKAFTFKTLPSILETMRLTFRVEGISVQDVTHLIRHRTFSFSAQCTGDRWLSHHIAVVPESIENSPEFLERYKEVTRASRELYADMIDSKKISIMDARLILNKNHDNFYYASTNVKDLLGFIKQRLDRQIQPKSDNIIAYQMYLALCRAYPIAHLNIIDFEAPSYHYIKNARNGHATNLYYPEANSDQFEWNENDFIYQGFREDINGTEKPEGLTIFEKMLEGYKEELEEMKIHSKRYLDELIASEEV
jgi:thymidylate synthase (FAD)